MKAEVVRLGYYGHAILSVNEFGGGEVVVTSGERALHFNLAVEEIEELIDALTTLARSSAGSQVSAQCSHGVCGCNAKGEARPR